MSPEGIKKGRQVFCFLRAATPQKRHTTQKKHMTDVCSPFFFLKSGTLSGRIFGRIFVGRLVMSLAVVEGKLAVVRAFANANEVQEMSQIFASWDTVTLWSQGVAHFFLHFFFPVQIFFGERNSGPVMLGGRFSNPKNDGQFGVGV